MEENFDGKVMEGRHVARTSSRLDLGAVLAKEAVRSNAVVEMVKRCSSIQTDNSISPLPDPLPDSFTAGHFAVDSHTDDPFA